MTDHNALLCAVLANPATLYAWSTQTGLRSIISRSAPSSSGCSAGWLRHLCGSRIENNGQLCRLRGRAERRWYGIVYDDRHVIPHLLAAAWPSIAFALPAA